jgi:hypothetical protein
MMNIKEHPSRIYCVISQWDDEKPFIFQAFLSREPAEELLSISNPDTQPDNFGVYRQKGHKGTLKMFLLERDITIPTIGNKCKK